jgi:Flp pilus assembly pilin Flp
MNSRFNGRNMFDLNDIQAEQEPRKTPIEERGASMVEYALLVVLIAIVGFLAVSNFGGAVSDTFSTIAGSIAAAN